jgi:hypothetical protein
MATDGDKSLSCPKRYTLLCRLFMLPFRLPKMSSTWPFPNVFYRLPKMLEKVTF